MRTVILAFVAVVIFYLYVSCLIYGVDSLFMGLDPSWWEGMFSTRGDAASRWMILQHTIAVALVSLPFACVLQLLYGRHGPTIALAMTLVFFIMAIPQLISTFSHEPIRFKLASCFDQLKLIGFLPLVTWVVGNLPSDSRTERHLTDLVPSSSARDAHAQVWAVLLLRLDSLRPLFRAGP